MKLSVVISFRNEELVLHELVARLEKVLLPLDIPYELIFVNDASTDSSLSILKQRAKENPNIKIINMSRNFGYTECILAGFQYASGSAVLYMDADLQDTPELIPKMIEKFQREELDVVYTTRLSRAGEPRLRMWLTKWSYRFLRRFSTVKLPVDSGDFKLMSRRVVEEVLKLREKNPFVKGLVTWVGFKQAPIFYHREERFAGKTHQPLFNLKSNGPIKTVLYGLISFSPLPIDFLLLVGFGISLLTFLSLIVILVLYCLEKISPGWTTMVTLLLFFGGLQLFILAVLGLYLGRIFEEVKGRPNYIVESTIGFKEKKVMGI